MVRFDPFSEMQTLQRQFFGDDWLTMRPRNLKLPTTDVYTKGDKEMIVETHIPNFDENDINVNIDKNTLEISAQKHEKEEDKDKKYVVHESSSSFYRRIQLPEVADADNIKAHFEDGMLKVTIPFKKLPAPKKVSVTSSTKKKA